MEIPTHCRSYQPGYAIAPVTVHAYVINLAEAAARRAHIVAQLSNAEVDYELVAGIDGNELDLADPRVVDPALRGQSWFQPGVAGCALSHLKVYRQILADGLDGALVLEDDIVIPAELNQVVAAVASQLAGAEVVLLNFDSDEPCRVTRQDSAQIGASHSLAVPLDVDQPRSTAAYLITREACERMCQTVLPVRVQADEWGFFCRQGALDRLRCVLPLTVHKSPAFGSSVHHPPASLKARVNRTLGQRNVPVLTRAVVARRARLQRHRTLVDFVDLPASGSASQDQRSTP